MVKLKLILYHRDKACVFSLYFDKLIWVLVLNFLQYLGFLAYYAKKQGKSVFLEQKNGNYVPLD